MPVFRSPTRDLRIIRRAYSNPQRRRYAKWFLGWLACGAVALSLSLLASSRLASGILLRLWLFGGAAYALKHSASLAPQPGEERVSAVGIIIILAIILGIGLVVGGSIMTLAGAS